VELFKPLRHKETRHMIFMTTGIIWETVTPIIKHCG